MSKNSNMLREQNRNIPTKKNLIFIHNVAKRISCLPNVQYDQFQKICKFEQIRT